MGGGLAEAKLLEQELAEFLEQEFVVLFPTGWAAGYGVLKGLLRPYDHVVLDALAHDCLQHGARASTANVSYFAHNDLDSLEKRLVKRRANHPDDAILVVTESLFSMDSDHADLARLLDVARAYDARVLVDVAHDLGLVGPAGKGCLAEAGVLRDVDFVMGSFSKTFASIGGFVATSSKAASYYVRSFSGSYTFSNFLTPPQVASVREALRIVRSPEGDARRAATLRNAGILRDEISTGGIECAGRISAMVIPQIGPEEEARRAYRRCLESGAIVNCIEFPGVARGRARFRCQVTPAHREEDLRRGGRLIRESIEWARGGHDRSA
jgi:7-keto-8-aminopelargonate synthetase-like enzyme